MPSVSHAGRALSAVAVHSVSDYVIDGIELETQLVVGSSSGLLQALDFERLQPTWSGSATARSLARIDANAFACATADGIALFDVRAGPAPTATLKGKQPYQSVAVGAQLAAGSELVGSDALVEIWDARTGRAIHVYTDVASDDVPSLQYAPNGHLLVGSTDGLVSVLDPSLPSEEDAVLHVANVGASVKAARWGTNGFIAQTDMETVELWRLAEDGPELFHTFGDVRQVEIAPNWSTDYVVAANPSPRGVDLFLGTNEGAVSLVCFDDAEQWAVEHVLTGAHSEIVRFAFVNAAGSVRVWRGCD